MRRWVMMGLTAALALPTAAAPKYSEPQVAELVAVAEAEKAPEAQRAKVIRQLENTDVRTHLSALRRLLRQERSLDIRLAAACTLAALGDQKAPRDLLLATAYDGERTPSCTRSDVLLALGRLGDPAAELHLDRALKATAPEDEPFYYADTCKALVALNTPGARKLLLLALRDGSTPVRHAVVTPLGKLALNRLAPEQQSAREALLNAARFDPDEKVAEQAASALFWLGVDPAGFLSLLERDPEAVVRARAARVMNRHYLSASRVQRLRTALGREKDATVRAAMEKTLASQPGKN